MEGEWFRGKTFVFKLLNTTCQERTTIWKGWSYKDTQIVDAEGKEMKFPMTDGELSGTDGVVYQFDQMKAMANKKFKELFPYFKMNITFIRSIDVGGNQFQYEFKKSINSELEKMCLMTPGDVPKAYFKQIFDKDKPGMQMYKLDVVSEEDAKNWLASHNASSDKPIGPIPKRIQMGAATVVQPTSTDTSTPVSQPVATPTPKPEGLVLDVLEQKLLTAIKGMGSKFEEDRFIKSFEQTYAKQSKTIDVERVKKIFNTMYN